MDGSTWASNAAAHPAVGPIPMGFEWSRDQNLNPSDSSARSIGLQGSFHAASSNHNGPSNGNGNGPMHNQATSLTGHTGISHDSLGADPNLNNNGVHGGMGAQSHHNGDSLATTLTGGQLQQGEIQVRTTSPTNSRDDFHHHAQPHHGQQQQQQIH
ncbi:hypothetical protein BGZ46_005251, partial [Entomortierella lignicola]